MASPVGICETELTGEPHEGQKRESPRTSAEHETHFISTVLPDPDATSGGAQQRSQRRSQSFADSISGSASAVAASSASGPTGAPVAFFIQRSGATLPVFAIRSTTSFLPNTGAE